MASLKFLATFWISCLVLCHIQTGSALFLSHKKKSLLNHIVKSKLEKLHAALSYDDHDHDHDYDIAHYHHYHYDPVPLIVVPHHHHSIYHKPSLGHYVDPWHLSHHSYHGWSKHHHDY